MVSNYLIVLDREFEPDREFLETYKDLFGKEWTPSLRIQAKIDKMIDEGIYFPKRKELKKKYISRKPFYFYK